MGYVFMIMGMSCSGKTTLFNSIIDLQLDNLYPLLQYTTRPPRPTEIDGEDYFFINTIEFDNMIKNNSLLEYREYTVRDKVYKYGICKDSIEKDKNYIVSGTDVSAYAKIYESLKNNDDIKVIPILLFETDYIILQRMLRRCVSRDDIKNACTRYLQDIDRYDPQYVSNKYNIPRENCIRSITQISTFKKVVDILKRYNVI